MNKETNDVQDYGNWVSRRLIYIPLAVAVFFLLLSFLISSLFLIVTAVFLAPFVYFTFAHYKFSASGGDIQTKIRGLVIDQLKWTGRGDAIDIGCGSGALSIKLAQKFPESRIKGIDYWGSDWGYSLKICESNARMANTAGRVSFLQASAAKLPFKNEHFDAAVSNLVFHEVHDARDKRELVREALRVLKKGGDFAFQDLFLLRKVYGDIDVFLNTIKSWGIDEVYFIDTSKSAFIPKFLRIPFMLGKIGIIYGKK